MQRRQFLVRTGQVSFWSAVGACVGPWIHHARAGGPLDDADAWLRGQVQAGILGSSQLLTDWGAQAFVALQHTLGTSAPELVRCDDLDCLVPSSPVSNRLRSAERTVLVHLSLGLAPPAELVDFLTTQLQAECAAGNPDYLLTPTKVYGYLTLRALELYGGQSHGNLLNLLGVRLVELQNSDGGWPIYQDGRPSELDLSAMALLCGLDDYGWVLQQQRPDGGFAANETLPNPSATSTAAALLAYPDNTAARSFLLSCQHASGYFLQRPGVDWPGVGNRILATAQAVLSLCDLGFPIPPLSTSGIPDDQDDASNSLRVRQVGAQISLSFPSAGEYYFSIFDSSGRLVWEESGYKVGMRESFWSGCSRQGARMPSGRYYARALTGSSYLMAKITLLR